MALCFYSIFYGEYLYDQRNWNEWMDNSCKDENNSVISAIINKCLDSNLEKRPSLETIQKEVDNAQIEQLLIELRNDEALNFKKIKEITEKEDFDADYGNLRYLFEKYKCGHLKDLLRTNQD